MDIKPSHYAFIRMCRYLYYGNMVYLLWGLPLVLITWIRPEILLKLKDEQKKFLELPVIRWVSLLAAPIILHVSKSIFKFLNCVVISIDYKP